MLVWDPDYTKLTKKEAEELAEAENSGFVRDDEIDWSKIGQQSCYFGGYE